MKKNFIRLIFIQIFLLASFLGRAQQIDSLIQVYHDSLPEEKIHVHFDKGYYNPGETIWWKAYIFTGIEPSIVSKNLYAELIDENGTLISRHTGPIIESGSAGSFALAANFAKDPVFFRAYTTNMLNGDTSFLYLKQIRIILPVKAGASRPVLQTNLQFLPESGGWVAGISSVIAFMATDQYGMPVKVSGQIKNKQGTKLLDFASTHNGMGSFELVPAKNEIYTATWKDAMGKEYSTPLPAVQEEGVTLRIKGSDAGQTFTVTRSATADEASKTLRIVAVMNQRMLYSAKANLTDVVAKSGMLPTAELPSGIMQITVLDANLKPLAERVVFINNREYEFDADVYLGVKNLEKRGLNKGEVIIADTMLSNLSLSVTDADLNAVPQYEDNIVSRFLLTGDLRGKIVNPYYYFFSTSDSANIHLNLVMLTHGWRRYNWPELLAGKLPLRTKKESNFLSIEGQLLGGEQGKIPPGTMLTGIIQAKDSTRTFISLPVDRFGRVKSDGMIFYDYAKLFFQFADTKRKFETSSLNVDNGLYKGMKSISFSAIDKMRIGGPDSTIWARNLKQASDEVKIAIQRNRKTQTLQEVIVKGKVKTEAQKMDERYTSGLFSGGDARSFDVANDPFGATSFSVFQYLQGKVAGLQISMAGGQPSLSWRGSSPVFYLNEMQSDVSLIQNINMSEVAYIKVFGPGAAGGMQTQGGGAIAVYTKKGGDVTDNSDAKGLSSLQITGYTDLKEFSSPDYATAAPTHDLPDLRTTLFWNPFIFLDKASRRYKFQFYNSDATKRFRLVLEGINIEGKFVHIEKLIQ